MNTFEACSAGNWAKVGGYFGTSPISSLQNYSVEGSWGRDYSYSVSDRILKADSCTIAKCQLTASTTSIITVVFDRIAVRTMGFGERAKITISHSSVITKFEYWCMGYIEPYTVG